MRLPRPLLPALLCLALVLNGIGGAMAGVRMGCASATGAIEHGAHAPAMASDDAHAGHDADAHHAGGHHAEHAPMPAAPAGDADGHDCSHGEGCGDCATACRSACLAQHAFAVPPIRWSALPPAPAAHAPPPRRDHPAPPLPDPIRPPIGQA